MTNVALNVLTAFFKSCSFKVEFMNHLFSQIFSSKTLTKYSVITDGRPDHGSLGHHGQTNHQWLQKIWCQGRTITISTLNKQFLKEAVDMMTYACKGL